jgi:hypothetical protein
MTNYYATELLVTEHQAALRHEADQDRLARLPREGRRGRSGRSSRVGSGRRWWERLMLFRSSAVEPATVAGSTRAATSPGGARRTTVAAGDSR